MVVEVVVAAVVVVVIIVMVVLYVCTNHRAVHTMDKSEKKINYVITKDKQQSQSHQIKLSVADAISIDDDMCGHLAVARFELSQQRDHGVSQRMHHLLAAVLSGQMSYVLTCTSIH